MMSKERDRDYAGSKGDTSLGRSFGGGSPAMYEDVISCDKTGAKPGEVCGAILAGIIGLRKTPQVAHPIVISLDAAAPFVAPAEGERPSERRAKTALVVTSLSPLETGG